MEADVDWQQMMLTVRGKTGERTVPFGKATASALRRYLRHRSRHRKAEDSALFIGDRGRITTSTVLVLRRQVVAVLGPLRAVCQIWTLKSLRDYSGPPTVTLKGLRGGLPVISGVPGVRPLECGRGAVEALRLCTTM